MRFAGSYMLVFSAISLVLGAANIQGSDVDSAASDCRYVSRQMVMVEFHNTYYLIDAYNSNIQMRQMGKIEMRHF